MNSLKLITTSSTIVISILILLVISHFLTRNIKSKIDSAGKLKLSYGIWYSAIFICGSNVISTIIDIVFEVVDNMIKLQSVNFYKDLVATVSLIVGVGFIWFMFWSLMVKLITKIILIKLNENEEMEDDNFSYFIIKGTVLIGVIFSLSSVLQLILKLLVPDVETPFYH